MTLTSRPILFFTNLVIPLIGLGLVPVLPLYAAEFGATPTLIGLYLAVISVAVTVGVVLTGWLTARFALKGVLLAAGLAGSPALALLGQATALWQVVVLTAVVWFVGGIGLSAVSILTGLSSDRRNRGQSFGLMELAKPLAAIAGGLITGQLATRAGYPVMFTVLSCIWASWPAVVLLARAPRDVHPVSVSRPASSDTPAVRFGTPFYLVLLITLLSAASVSIGRLSTTLSMHELTFPPTAIASTGVVGGLVMIPLAPLIGTVSDHIGRRRLLVLGYLLAGGGSLILGRSTEIWHFWLATVLLFTAASANASVAAALATDLLQPSALRRGLPWLTSMPYIASIIAFGGTGYLMERLGMSATVLVAVGLAGTAIGLLQRLPREVGAAPAAVSQNPAVPLAPSQK